METEIAQGISDAEKLFAVKSNSFDNLLHFNHLKQTSSPRVAKLSYSEFVEAKERQEFEEFKFAQVKDDILYFQHQLELLL
jgi:hypothetical protein